MTRTVPFLVVGAVGFVVQLGVLAILTRYWHWPAAVATAVAVEAAVLFNFVWHTQWTWRDRARTPRARAEQLWRFHASNGVNSIAANVLVTAALTRFSGVDPLLANGIAVVLLGIVNFLAADRWVFARRAAIAATVLLTTAAPGRAATLQTETLKAWNQHVAQVEASLPQRLAREHPVEPEGRIVDVPDGTIHEWRGSILIRKTTVRALVDALQDAGTRPLQEDVAESRVLERHPDSLRMYLKLVRRVIITVTYDTEHSIRYERLSPTLATSRSIATRIEETGENDRGFLWKLNSYWRYEQVGDDVRVDVLSVSLSRDIPWVIRPVATPLITRVGRESMSRTLATVQRTATMVGQRPAVKAN